MKLTLEQKSNRHCCGQYDEHENPSGSSGITVSKSLLQTIGLRFLHTLLDEHFGLFIEQVIVEHNNISFQIARQPSNPTIQKIIGAETARVKSNFLAGLPLVILYPGLVLIYAFSLIRYRIFVRRSGEIKLF